MPAKRRAPRRLREPERPSWWTDIEAGRPLARTVDVGLSIRRDLLMFDFRTDVPPEIQRIALEHMVKCLPTPKEDKKCP